MGGAAGNQVIKKKKEVFIQSSSYYRPNKNKEMGEIRKKTTSPCLSYGLII